MIDGMVEWLAALHAQAWERFNAGRWPTTSDEEWRRSDISNYDFDRYKYIAPVPVGEHLAEQSSATDAHASDTAAIMADAEHYAGQIHFHNGVCQQVGTEQHLIDQGVLLLPLQTLFFPQTALPALPDAVVAQVRAVIERNLLHGDNRLYDWHYALLNGGALLYVPPGLTIDKPFRVVFRHTGDAIISAPHVVAIVERGASAALAEWVTTSDEGEQICLDGADIVVGDNASLQYAVMHDPNLDSSLFSNPIARIGRDGRLHHSLCVLGGMFAKTRFDLLLKGAGADALLDGIYFGYQDQHVDLRTVQFHDAPHTTSRTFYRGAVRDEAHIIYQGLIHVAKAARGTDAYLTNNNLLLNDGARSDSIPSLNISTDDVKCSHGSTSGKLDPLQRFYLQSRGYEPVEADALLIEGFFEGLIANLPTPMQPGARAAVRQRIVAEADED